MPISKKNQLIGIDVGSHSIKIVEIEDTKKGMVLKNFGIIGLPQEAIVEGSIKEMEIVSTALKNLLKNLKIKNKNVATSISGYSVIVKKITIPKKERVDLEQSIQSEAEQYIPEEFMDVLLVAAKKDIVEEYISLLHLSEINPLVLDIDAFALQNVFEISDHEQSGCHALVNIGAQQLTINVIDYGVSIFTRDSAYGGAQITSEIQKKLNISYQEAENIKLGAKPIENEKRPIIEDIFTTGEKRPIIEDIFTTGVSNWCQEIKRALDFVRSTSPNIKIENILLSGGSSLMPGFSKYLGLETDLKVEMLDPFPNIEIREKTFDISYLKYMAPQAAVSIGLALRYIGDK
jgi:type IV pilus assembly protein PilM